MMEYEEIYKILRSIKRHLFILTCFFGVIVGLICFAFFESYMPSQPEVSHCSKEKEEENRMTYYEMERNRQLYAELRINKDFGELLKKSREQLEKNQNDITSMYSEAEALYFLGEYEKSKEKFLATLEVAPSYKIYIDPYLENIEKKQK